MGVSSKMFVDSDQQLLNLVDGGEDGEGTPFQPLLVKARGVDTIIAIDAVRDSCQLYRQALTHSPVSRQIQIIGRTAAPSS